MAIDLTPDRAAPAWLAQQALPFAIAGASALAIVLTPTWLVALALLILVLALPLLLDMFAGRFDPFELRNPFLFGYFLQFGASTLTSVSSGPRYYSDRLVLEADLPGTLLTACAALICFYAGYHWRRTAPRESTSFKYNWNPRLAATVAGLYAVTGIFVFAYFMAQVGGIFSLLAGFSRLNYLLLGKYYLVLLLRNLPLVATLILFIEARAHGGWRNWAAWLSLSAISIESGTLGERGPAIFNLVAVAIVYHFATGARRSVPRWFEIAAALGALLTVVLVTEAVTMLRFSHLGAEGVSSVWELIKQPGAREMSLESTAESAVGRFEGAEVLGIILRRTGRVVPFGEGASFTDIITMIVPRAIWPEKPISSGFRVEELFLDSVAGGELASSPSPTLPGEFYWNFGYVGMALGMFIVGLASGAVNRYFHDRRTASSLLIYIGFFLWLLGISDGGIGASAIALTGYMVPATVAIRLIRR